LDEADFDEWLSLHADSVDAPEDWSGSFDVSAEDPASKWHPEIRDWQSEFEVADQDRSQITETD